jgi:ribosome-binding protein aMBF1 (putative translation factor)
MAEKLGMTQPGFSNWEVGKITPNPQQVKKVEEVVGPLSTREPGESAEETGPGPVGTWLLQARQQKGLTKVELAKKSGVSYVVIRNIETGRTQNPHEPTLKKLEAALGALLPEEAQGEAEREATIEGLGEFIDFDPYDENDRPEDPGVYVLYDISERPIYVGEGQNIGKRIKDHQDRFWFKPPVVDSASYVVIRKDEMRRQVEKILIKFLKSNAVLNKEHVDRS